MDSNSKVATNAPRMRDIQLDRFDAKSHSHSPNRLEESDWGGRRTGLKTCHQRGKRREVGMGREGSNSSRFKQRDTS